MTECTSNKDGYIVFEDSGISPISYGASEKWFPDYDSAIEYAISIVSRRAKELKEVLDVNSVIVFTGSKELLNKSHSAPPENEGVVFSWNNYRH